MQRINEVADNERSVEWFINYIEEMYDVKGTKEKIQRLEKKIERASFFAEIQMYVDNGELNGKAMQMLLETLRNE